MILFTVLSALEFLNENIKINKNQKKMRLRAEVLLTTRTTPNNLFIAVCGKKKSSLFYWISRGRERYNFLKFNNFFSLKRMFIEVVAFTLKYRQIVFKLIGKGRSRVRPFSKEFRKWKIPVFFVINKIRRPFNGCKFPHTRRI